MKTNKRLALNPNTDFAKRTRFRSRFEKYCKATNRKPGNALAVLALQGLEVYERATCVPVSPIMDEEDATAAAMRKAGR